MQIKKKLFLIGALFGLVVALVFGIPKVLKSDEYFQKHDVLGIQLFQKAWE